MIPALLPLAHVNQLWYALPLIVAVSLSYAATRHEVTGEILHHAVRTFVWITGFMGVVFIALYIISLFL